MIECRPVAFGKEEILLPIRHRPVERQRNLIHWASPMSAPVQREILRLLLPVTSTCQPWACSAAASEDASPT